MLERPPISPSDFFSNAAAREIGLTDQFWFDAYAEWHVALNNDTAVSFDTIFDPRTFRIPFRGGNADVLVRVQPEGHEHYAIRLTAFPADASPTPQQIPRWYWDTESRAVLGEAVLLDANFPW